MLGAIFVLALMGATPADDATLAELTKRVDALEQRQFLTEKKLDDANGKLDKILSALAGNPPAPVPTFKSTWGQATLTPGQPLAAAGWGSTTQSFQSSQSTVGASAGACVRTVPAVRVRAAWGCSGAGSSGAGGNPSQLKRFN